LPGLLVLARQFCDAGGDAGERREQEEREGGDARPPVPPSPPGLTHGNPPSTGRGDFRGRGRNRPATQPGPGARRRRDVWWQRAVGSRASTPLQGRHVGPELAQLLAAAIRPGLAGERTDGYEHPDPFHRTPSPVVPYTPHRRGGPFSRA